PLLGRIAQVVAERAEILGQPAGHLEQHVDQRALLGLGDLPRPAHHVGRAGGRRDHEQRGDAPHTTPPRCRRLLLSDWNACSTPSDRPETTFAGLAAADDAARAAWSTVPTAPTAESVIL